MTVKLLMLVVFFSIMLGVGFYSRRHATNVNDFVLGGRGVGPWLTAFAYGTSYFSAVVFIGYAGQFGWKYGLASTWIGIGNALIGSLLAWVILGRRTRVMSKHLSSATMPEFFGSRFHSQGMKIAASLIIFVFLIPYTASVYNGLSRLFGMAFDIPYSVCVMGMAVLTAVYVILGGYMATAINDFIQGIIMLAGIQDIPRSYYESAQIDGAGSLRQTFYITLPLCTPTIYFNLIVTVIAAFQVFQQPLILTNGGPLNSTYTAAMHLYNNGFLYGKMGYASMMAWSMFAVIMLITIVVVSTSKFWVFYDD